MAVSESPRPSRRFLRWVGIAVAAIVGVPLALVAVIVAFGVTVNLDSFRPDIEAAAGEALGRALKIEGPLTLDPSLTPALAARSIRVAGAPGSDTGDSLRIDRARVSVRLLPLARRELHIHEIALDGVHLRLGEAKGRTTDRRHGPETTPASPEPSGRAAFEFVRLGALTVGAAIIEYRDDASSDALHVRVDRLEGSAGRDDPTVVTLTGTVAEHPLSISLSGGSLAALGDPQHPWPVTVEARLADAVASVTGAIADPLEHPSAAVDVTLKASGLESVAALTGTALPGVGALDVETHLEASSSRVRFSGIEAALGETRLRGGLGLDLDTQPPRLSGSIHMTALDVSPFLADASDSTAPAAPDESDDGLSLDDVALSLEGLGNLDADIAVTADRVLGLPMDVRHASVAPSLEGGRLEVPLSAIVSQVPLEGRLALEAHTDELAFHVVLSSEGSDMENLRRITPRAKGVEGSFERFTLRGSARGATLRAALENLDASVLLERADLSYGHERGGEPIPLMLENFALNLPKGGALHAATRGALFHRDFALELAGATVAEALAGGAWPMRLAATGAGARLSAEGNVGEPGSTNLRIRLAGDRIGDLAPWIGTSPDSELAFAVQGELRFDDHMAYLEAVRAHVGRTALEGEFTAGWRNEDLMLGARARFPLIDTGELTALFASPADAGEQEDRPGLNLYMPVLPQGVVIVDADFDIRADRILAHPVDVTAASFSGSIREGFLQKSPFAATLGPVPFAGELSLDLRGRVPVATLDVTANDVDFGALLNDLEITVSSETRARLLRANMILRGEKPKSMIRDSELFVVLEDAVMTVRDPNTRTPLEIHAVRSSLTARPGEPVVYDIEGRIESTPATFRVETSPLASLLDSADPLPVRLTSDIAGMHLRMDASLRRPFSLRNIRFDLHAEGQNLDSLHELIQVSVPPWGPYAIAGTIELDRIGYHAPSLTLRVGSSQLAGDVSLDTTGARPRLTMNLTGESLQLDDFDVGAWSAFEHEESKPPRGSTSRTQALRQRKATVKALATSDTLRSFDARVSMAVNEVLSGNDRLGSGHLVAGLDNGRFSLNPIRVEIPEGSAEGELSFEMRPEDVVARTKVRIAHLDYGVLARRIDPRATAAGWLSLDVDLRSHSRRLEDMMAGANGRFDFAVWPTDMQADIFDLWAANLLLAILPSIDSESGSRVNCVVGVFDATDGVMSQKRLLIDTTNVQVQGEGNVDFRTGAVDFLLVPNAKRPQMFVLGTPIRVRGNYWDLETSTSPDQWARTAVRFVGSIFAPIKRLFTTPIPADGEAACRAAMERTED